MIPSFHVALWLIWEYSQNPGAFVPAEEHANLVHFQSCKDCASILRAFQALQKVEQLKQGVSGQQFNTN
jgi:hypothetical protein